MAIWEYKVISSGRGGFATPALLEKFLNDLGKEEWEIIDFRTPPDNPLAFSGLARRPTQRDWTLEDAAAAAAKAEADKLRAEFEAKFKGAGASGGAAAEEKPETLVGEKAAADDGLRRLRDTERDQDPDADEEVDEWDKLASEDELPTFFDAIRPHMRRNQRGPGMAVGLEYLAKKWDFSEDDIKSALVECGFAIPEDEEAKPEYVEYDGDLYWVNANRRGELWINTKEKPRPVFRTVQAQRVAVEEEPKPENGGRKAEGAAQKSEERAQKTEDRGQRAENGGRKGEGPESGGEKSRPESATAGRPAAASTAPLPEGAALLDRIRPMMRRNRRGPGGSGSTSFLSRALKCSETDLMGAFAALGLRVPETQNEKPVFLEVGDHLWWLNKDQRGGVWINGREKRDDDSGKTEEEAPKTETPFTAETPAATEAAENASMPGQTESGAPASREDMLAQKEPELPLDQTAAADAVPAPAQTGGSMAADGSPLSAVRLLLKETRTGSVAGKLERVAEELGKSPDDLLATLTGAGLKVPEKPREKPVFVEHAGEIFWLNKNAKDELWVNAKASKFAKGEESGGEEGSITESGEKKSRRPRSRKKEE